MHAAHVKMLMVLTGLYSEPLVSNVSCDVHSRVSITLDFCGLYMNYGWLGFMAAARAKYAIRSLLT